MAEPFLSEIRIVPYTFAPKGWAFCDGQTLSINQNQALFSLLGTTFGGDGMTTFALPNLLGRLPVHAGEGAGLSVRNLGENGGSEVATLTLAQIPSHSHTIMADATEGSSAVPTGLFLAAGSTRALYGAATSPVALTSTAVSTTAATAHENRMPGLALTFIIALTGIFPSRN